MIIGSLNCNKRLSNQKVMELLQTWLVDNNIDLFLAQEPSRSNLLHSLKISRFEELGGNSNVFSWVKPYFVIPEVTLLHPFLQSIDFGNLIIFNVYLDAYSRKIRSEQLIMIKEMIISVRTKQLIILGDFNLAPNLVDGMNGLKYSNFNGKSDRASFNEVLTSANLVDTTSKEKTRKQEYTIERKNDQSTIRFRCDLCVTSESLFSSESFSVKYDHSIRNIKTGLSDHSAMIINVPIDKFHAVGHSLNVNKEEKKISNVLTTEMYWRPHNTAISRPHPTKAAEYVTSGFFSKLLGERIRLLDYGCGRGKDLEFYREMGFDAVGYDPYPEFGFSQMPSGLFDLVLNIFVLNVLPTSVERFEVIRKAAEFLRKDGLLLLVTRSKSEIDREARQKDWKVYNDGFCSDYRKGTFQKGLTTEELIDLTGKAGLKPHPDSKLLKFDSSTCHLLVIK